MHFGTWADSSTAPHRSLNCKSTDDVSCTDALLTFSSDTFPASSDQFTKIHTEDRELNSNLVEYKFPSGC